MKTRMNFAAVVVASALVVAGCGETQTSTMESTTTETSAVATAGEGELQLENGTVRAKADAAAEGGTDMTAIFGVLHNTSDAPIEVTGFTTSLGEADYQIHETQDGTMQEMTEPLVIPAGGTHEFAPGGDHFMIMGYAPEIAAGDVVDLTIEAADGQTYAIEGVSVRTMLPGGEDYGEDGQLTGETAHGAHEGH